MNVVWFKRDLRITDHEALTKAARLGPVLPLFIFEPQLWQQLDMSERHYLFLYESLRELNESLKTLGQKLIVRIGDSVEIFQQIHSKYRIQSLWSHQETWNGWTYARDIQVKKWMQSQQIPWHEPRQHGVIRKLNQRDGWSLQWYNQMKKPVFSAPRQLIAVEEYTDKLPRPIERHSGMLIQKGGRSEALKLLDTFLNERGKHYTREMSSPVTAYDSCSRLSPHIAFGTVSVREVFQACEQRKKLLQSINCESQKPWLSAMRSFSGRLRWHCHFIQKLEDEPRIEFENMHPSYDNLRKGDFNQVYFEAWKSGNTGYPMIDACMRALLATGWLNFRMRAMLMSFASYHLWLDWRETSLHLARLFTDYEPGIHYSQVQMQSGTTGINSIRIYNPIKQGIDQDPEGIFIRHWLPELHQVEQSYIHTPWLVPEQMGSYPMPIVDEGLARKAAADKLYGLRKNNIEHKEEALKIVHKHASRKVSSKPRKKKKQIKDTRQGELPL